MDLGKIFFSRYSRSRRRKEMRILMGVVVATLILCLLVFLAFYFTSRPGRV